MKSFVVVYNTNTGKADIRGEFDDYDLALAMYIEVKKEMIGNSHLESNLIGAKDVADLKDSNRSIFHYQGR